MSRSSAEGIVPLSSALAFLTVTTFLLCLAGGTELICSLCIVPYLVRTVLGTVLAASVTSIIIPAVLTFVAIVTTTVVIAVLILAVTVIFPAVIISAVVQARESLATTNVSN